MAIPDSDPRAQDLDAAFAAAMDAPARPVSVANPPPEVDRDAPHGRGEDGKPLAPHGYLRDGITPRKGPQGRPAKDSPDRPRTATVTDIRPPGDKPKVNPDPRDWTKELDGLATAAWFGLSAVSKITDSVPIVGKLVPGEKLAAEALVLHETKGHLIAAVNLAAQHNAKAAAFCAKLEGGDGLWALTCMFMVMPVLSTAATVWRGDKAMREAGMQSVAELAKENESKFDDMLASVQAQIVASMQPAQPETEPAGAGAS